jgi:hypothetical protein
LPGGDFTPSFPRENVADRLTSELAQKVIQDMEDAFTDAGSLFGVHGTAWPAFLALVGCTRRGAADLEEHKPMFSWNRILSVPAQDGFRDNKAFQVAVPINAEVPTGPASGQVR